MHISLASKHCLLQLQDLLKKLNDSIYSQPIEELYNTSIGQHTRHTLEFYICLIQQSGTGEVVNYGKRKRNNLLETSVEQAIDQINVICKNIDSLDHSKNMAFEGTIKGGSFCLPSSVERELIHNFEHTIHHMAIIKIALNILKINISLDPSFGVADSTLKHRQCAQ